MSARKEKAEMRSTSWPADRVERRPLAGLLPYANNARTHSPAQVAQIAASIEKWGWTSPVLIDEQGQIIAGHGRVLAARKLSLLDVPVIVAAEWSDAQKRAYVIADNKLALNAGWDDDLLRLEFDALNAEGFDLGLLGFSGDELNHLFEATDIRLADAHAIPPCPAIPVSRPGDLWLLGEHRLLCGDATNADNVARALGGMKPGLMVTDPPYGVAYDPSWRAKAGINRNTKKLGKVRDDGRCDWREAWRHFEGDVAYVWHAGVRAGDVAESLRASGLDIRSQIIWAKDRFALSRGDYHWQHEPCWYCVRKDSKSHWSGSRSQATLWTIPARDDDGHGHGTQKPVLCMRKPIQNNSLPGTAVYDPFMGSGTTLIAAELERRSCLGLEIDPFYVDVAVLRWQALTGHAAVLSSEDSSVEERSSSTAVSNGREPTFELVKSLRLEQPHAEA